MLEENGGGGVESPGKAEIRNEFRIAGSERGVWIQANPVTRWLQANPVARWLQAWNNSMGQGSRQSGP